MRCASTRLRRAFSLSPSNRSSTKHKRWVLLASAAANVTMSALPALAANLTWDASATTPSHATDGAGSWDTTNVNWSNGTTDAAWNTAGGNTAVFGNANGAAGNVVIDDASGGVTATGLIFNAPGSGAYTISASGTDVLTLSGTNPSLLVRTGVSATISAPIAGTFGSGAPGSGSTSGIGLFINGGGTVTFTSASNTYTGSTTIAYNVTDQSTPTNVILGNGAALGNTGGDIYIGYPQNTATGKTDTSSMALGALSTDVATVTARTLFINYNQGGQAISTTTGSSLIVNGNDTINANTIILDAGRNGSNTKGGLATMMLSAGAVLTLNGANGTGNSVTTLDVANYSYETGGGTGTGINAVADFSLGTVNGTINTVNIGTGKAGSNTSSSTGTSNGSMSFANGVLNVGAINIARRGSQPSKGTLTLAPGTGILTAGGITFAGPGGGGATAFSTSAGEIDINGATLALTGDINSTGISGSSPAASATIVLAGGTFDMGNHKIGSSGTPITLTATSGTLQNVNHINDTAGVTMSGTGILTLAGTNAYTGATTVTSGTILANGANAMGAGGPLVVNNGTRRSGCVWAIGRKHHRQQRKRHHHQ